MGFLEWVWFSLAIGVAYVIGSLPTGILMAKIFGFPDPRTLGSKGTGATNVTRAGGKWAGSLTLVIDCGKGFFAAWLCEEWVGNDFAALVGGFAALLGHCFPVWIKDFQGGKGVASLFGVLLEVDILATAGAGIVWILLFAFLRTSSISSLLASISGPLVLWYLGFPDTALFLLPAIILVWARHYRNILRLAKGEELAFRKNEDAS